MTVLTNEKKHMPCGKIITDTFGHNSRQEEFVFKKQRKDIGYRCPKR